MGLMSDEILGNSSHHDDAMDLRSTLTRGPKKKGTKSYLKNSHASRSVSDHRRTLIKSSLFSAIDGDESSQGSFGEDLVESNSGRTSRSLDEFVGATGSAPSTKKRGKRADIVAAESSAPPPPPPPPHAPSPSRKSLSGLDMLKIPKRSGGSKSPGILTRKTPKRSVSATAAQLSHDAHSSTKTHRRGSSLVASDQHNESSEKPSRRASSFVHSDHKKDLNPQRRRSSILNINPQFKLPDRARSKSFSAGNAGPKPSEQPKKGQLGSFLASNEASRRRSDDDEDDFSDDDDNDSVTSGQSWISWAASAAASTTFRPLEQLEKMYDNLNGLENEESDDEDEFPNTASEDYAKATRLSTTEKIASLRYAVSKAKRKALFA
eukprot:Nitzschia sp. Nitz4//scaffold11_size288233//237861//238994//NITZ4_000810-RA/size288233-processed-gene-0.247-mRNA-1//-1//CDS//3329534182//9207//frame0